MPRGCGCAGSTCGCRIIAGPGISISGTGTIANPYVIENTADALATSFLVNDTSTLNLTLGGGGTTLDPFILSGDVTLAMTQLSDVSGTPSVGDVPTWNGSAFTFEAGGGGGGTVKFAVNVPAANPATINHALGTLDVLVAVYEIATGNQVFPDVDLSDVNNLSLTFGSAPTVGQYRAVVVG